MITTVVLCRGPQNSQTMEQAKLFLAENRSSVVAIFKRQTKIGPKPPANAGADIGEIIDLFVLLITITQFLEVG